MNDFVLQNEFVKGIIPGNLDGFHKGEMAALFPNTIGETLGAVFLKIWMPWKGKYFYKDKQVGDNILSRHLATYLRFRFNDFSSPGSSDKLFHAFPFGTYVMHGVHDEIPVLRLSYDLPQNPSFVRNIIDELVQVGEGSYLGKAFIQERNNIR